MTIEIETVQLAFHERMALAVSRLGGRKRVAEHFGLAPLTVSRWTTGKTVPPTITVRAVAMTAGLPYEWLRPTADETMGRSVVRHQGLEPRTHWLRAFRAWDVVAEAESLLVEAVA